MEHNQRRARGREVELQDHLRRLKSRATNSTLRAVDGAVEIVPDFVDFDVAKDFLLAALQDVGIKRRQNLVKGVWTDLESLIPYGAVFDFNISTDPEDNIDACSGVLLSDWQNLREIPLRTLMIFWLGAV